MENTAIAIILLLINQHSKGNQLTHIMIVGCLVATMIEGLNIDIAFYYALNAILLSLLAQHALKLKSTSAFLYAIMMIIQMSICVVLFTDYGESLNNTFQEFALYITDKAGIITILLAVSGSDNIISRKFTGAKNEA